jgi:hypothetical protein
LCFLSSVRTAVLSARQRLRERTQIKIQIPT